jgi:alpha-mannosidase
MRAPTCPDRTGDHGISTFIYAYYPHKNGWQDAETVRNGLCLNVPPVARVAGKQDGSLESGMSFLKVEGGSFTVDCIKNAQDGRGIIIRIAEEERRRGKGKVTWKLGGKTVTECNMIEEDETAVEFDGETFQISTEPNSLGAVRDALEAGGYTFLSAEVAYVPQTMSTIDDPDLVVKMERLIDMLEENDDVQAVWHNWEMPEE